MIRVARGSSIAWAIAVAIAGASCDARSAPPANSTRAQIAALKSQVATLSAQVAALQGAAGPVPVWQATGGIVPVQRNDATNVSAWTLSTAASLALPAGSYLVVAKTVVQDPEVSASTFYCFLTRPAGNFDESVGYSVQDEPVTITLKGVVTLSASGSIALRCGASGPASASGSAVAYDTKLVAVQATLQ